MMINRIMIYPAIKPYTKRKRETAGSPAAYVFGDTAARLSAVKG